MLSKRERLCDGVIDSEELDTVRTEEVGNTKNVLRFCVLGVA